ncbi:hypothetical protein [Caballeronia calidae]|uniref:hypothetical protein n=1 Tax=Caballeronia calidae TaxID=1777139 RepID=UPI0012FD322A|nr:hypothetical protein [Caballeronia calidae]
MEAASWVSDPTSAEMDSAFATPANIKEPIQTTCRAAAAISLILNIAPILRVTNLPSVMPGSIAEQATFADEAQVKIRCVQNE